jgi:hypothetical protein
MINNIMTKALRLGVLAGISALNAEASDNKALLNKLVEKGTLTRAEADALLEESHAEFNSSVPSWVDSLTLKGDLRLRYDHVTDSPSSGAAAHDRWRYRFRYGGTASMNNGVKAGFRLATGGEGATDDIGSTNQTFSNGFALDSISLDQAWAQMEVSEVTLIGGKLQNFEKNGWKVSKALFDGDISPEGFEAHYSTDAGGMSLGFHGGVYFVNGENIGASSNINNMYMGQITANGSLNESTKLDLGFGAYTVDDGGLGSAGKSARKGNSSGVGYSPVFLDGVLGFKTGPGIKLYGTWVNNQESSATKDTGYISGIKFGSAKKAGQWEAKIEYRSLEKDAVWDDLTDSDFGAFGAGGTADEFKSGTNVEGTILQFKYMIYDNVQTAVTLFTTESEDGTDGESSNSIKADLIFKF